MFSDLQTFTINGYRDDALEKVLNLAMELDGTKEIKSFCEDPKGLVFYSYEHNSTIKYPFSPTTKVLVEHVNNYIDSLSDEKIIALAGETPDIDGSVELGWEVFHPLWYGKDEIETYEWSAVVAVRPCWIVYGK